MYSASSSVQTTSKKGMTTDTIITILLMRPYLWRVGRGLFPVLSPLSPEEIFQSACWTSRLALAYNEPGLVPRSKPDHGTGLWLQGDTSDTYEPVRNFLLPGLADSAMPQSEGRWSSALQAW